jgi:hypothetical protein
VGGAGARLSGACRKARPCSGEGRIRTSDGCAYAPIAGYETRPHSAALPPLRFQNNARKYVPLACAKFDDWPGWRECLGGLARSLVARDGGLVARDGGLVARDGGLVARDGGLVARDGGLVARDLALGARDLALVARGGARLIRLLADARVVANNRRLSAGRFGQQWDQFALGRVGVVAMMDLANGDGATAIQTRIGSSG